jgi:hypothetical protein
VVAARHFRLVDLLEGKHAAVEVDGAVEVGDREPDGVDGADELCLAGRRREDLAMEAQTQGEREEDVDRGWGLATGR